MNSSSESQTLSSTTEKLAAKAPTTPLGKRICRRHPIPAVSTAVTKLAQDLIRTPSITPQDNGCQDIIRQRLETLGFGLVLFSIF
jgi:hypothetical protein